MRGKDEKKIPKEKEKTALSNVTTKCQDCTSSRTHPPNDSIAIKNEDVDIVQELRLGVTQFQYVGHAKGRRESSCRRRRKGATASKGGNIAGCCQHWRSQEESAGGGCKIHGTVDSKMMITIW